MRFLGWLFWATLSPILLLQLRGIGGPLEIPGVEWGIVSYELAFTAERAREILTLWQTAGVTESARVSLGVDGAFLVAYPMLFFTSIRLLRDYIMLKTDPLGAIARVLSWSMLACIPLDALENVLLWRMIATGPTAAGALLAGLAASIKFLLVLLGIAWCLAVIGRRLTTRTPAH
ncbi:MAG: hypothetical protein IBJ03_07665 [Gemmatimonadaceae bacterium]|nr:hypothetical protein [Gemmatimonadaceae bacterium]